MKILYAVVECNTGNHQNAKERYVYNLALEAKHRGHDVAVACPSTSPLFTFLTKMANTGIDVYPLDPSKRSDNWPLFGQIKTFSIALKSFRPDIVHFNCPRFAAIGGLVSKIFSIKKTIYTYHEWHTKLKSIDINSNKQWFYNLWRKFLAICISQIAIASNHKIIALSKKEEEKIRNWPGIYFGKENKLTTIRNGIKKFTIIDKDKALTSLVGQERAIELIKNNKRVLGSIASLTPDKGYIYALQGLAQYKRHIGNQFNTHYIIVGDGHDLHSLQNIVADLGLENDVTFVGFIREAREYIKAFDFLVSNIIADSHSHETASAYPQVILEAGFAEVPVIATETGSISEIMENLENGYLVPPARPGEIKHILNYIDEHSGFERTYAKKLKEKIDEDFSFISQADKTFALY